MWKDNYQFYKKVSSDLKENYKLNSTSLRDKDTTDYKHSLLSLIGKGLKWGNYLPPPPPVLFVLCRILHEGNFAVSQTYSYSHALFV